MTVKWIAATFPMGMKTLDRNNSLDLPEHRYPGAPGDEHEALGKKALVIRAVATLPTTYLNGRVERTAEEYYSDLEKAHDLETPDTLYLENGSSHRVYLRNLVRRDISVDEIEVEMEFVETMIGLSIVRVPPTPEMAVENIETELDLVAAQAVEANIPDTDLSTLDRIKALYAAAQDWVSDTRGKVTAVTSGIVSVRNLGADFGSELERLSADVSELVIETTSLYNDFCADPIGTFAIGRSLRTTLNNLKGLENLIAIPPKTRGAVNKKAFLGKLKKKKVAEGDTLQTISVANYGSPHMWPEIARANGISDPADLTPGQELIIPTLTPERVASNCPGEPQLFKVEL